MAITMRAADVSLYDLSSRFGLQPTEETAFFPEWHADLSALSEQEKQQLDRIRAGYLHLMSHTALLEDAVKMVVLSPLLSLADFFLPPFDMRSEVAVQLSIEDDATTIEGKIDILVLQDRLWIMLIEAKRAAVSIEVGLPQLLTYMLANPNPAQPVYGLLTNGGSFVFLKLVQATNMAHYALSRIFEMRNPGNELYLVLAGLKNLARLVLQPHPRVRTDGGAG